MAKRKDKEQRLKLPRKLLGVKIPKATRKRANGLLRQIPAKSAQPLAAAAVAAVLPFLVDRLETTLQTLLDAGQKPGGRQRKPGDSPVLDF